MSHWVQNLPPPTQPPSRQGCHHQLHLYTPNRKTMNLGVKVYKYKTTIADYLFITFSLIVLGPRAEITFNFNQSEVLTLKSPICFRVEQLLKGME